MRLMLAAVRAKFLKLQALGCGLLVLGRGIVPILAFLTLESDDIASHLCSLRPAATL
jgi:hypothetical protein